ncbi:uncharacterized protein FRV6_14186 [Fusarium oxysporum]|uniref:Uncharacterized protein n=1 Tax=Fusarium oxysporum TaxID=5507 RepID=A0A2H3TN36_FUSOX|nr:uncharacterized protein FRV6_14186 [Fusarium oxysporum]
MSQKNGILSVICAGRQSNHELSEIARALIIQAVESGSSADSVAKSHEQQYAELSGTITVANGGLCNGYRYLKKPLVSGFFGVKLGGKISMNCWRPFSATNRQFNRNPIINEIGYSGSLMRSS